MSVTKIENYRDLCQTHLTDNSPKKKFLYWECMPDHLIDVGYNVKIQINFLEWQNNYSLKQGKFSNDHPKADKSFEEYQETCKANLKFIFTTSIIIPVDHTI